MNVWPQTNSPELVLVNSRVVVILTLCLAAFALLDRVSFVEPFDSLGIRPWDPTVGLVFALVLRFGHRMTPLLVIGPLVGELVGRQITLPWAIVILSPVLTGAIYLATILVLRSPKVRFDPALGSLRDLVLLIIAVGVGTAVVAVNYVLMIAVAGLLSANDAPMAVLHYWIGKVIGILGFTPLVLFALTRRRLLPLSMETGVQCAAILAALWLVFGSAEERQFQLFYVLFLPIVWLAVRAGTEWGLDPDRGCASRWKPGRSSHLRLRTRLFPRTRRECISSFRIQQNRGCRYRIAAMPLNNRGPWRSSACARKLRRGCSRIHVTLCECSWLTRLTWH
jgi:integral membrane sensor domain MASE1